MNKYIRIVCLLLTPIVFFTVLIIFIPPVWRWCEKGFIQEYTEKTSRLFPILIKSHADDKNYRIISFSEIAPDTPIVTEVDEEDLTKINNDLRSTILGHISRRYFEIIDKGSDYIDVSLEKPTTHDSMLKGWYRIQDKKIIPQKVLMYGPGFAFVAMSPTLLIAAICSALYIWAVIKLTKKRKA
ncbi:MAG: hypothetical protein A2Y10_16575 [Planctomycetes bacterium GWF2_41_51]|nr:MAG: hypothetical protein A2Y10_16575 [Planctomycetes bacterium GWF2_41_51]HBG28918.1 hypothetical protein [Phycisphaerales bacterium]